MKNNELSGYTDNELSSVSSFAAKNGNNGIGGPNEKLDNMSAENEPEYPTERFAKTVSEYEGLIGEADTIFSITRDQVAEDFYRSSPIKKQEFGFLDRITKRKDYKKYLGKIAFAESIIDKTYKDLCNRDSKQKNDKLPIIPKRLANLFIEVINDPDYTLAIHESYQLKGANIEDDKNLQDIMRNGLENAGHIRSGVFEKDPPVTTTVTLLSDIVAMKQHLTKPYNGYTCGIILAFPNKYVGSVGQIKDQAERIYNYSKDGVSIIKPEYILGAVYCQEVHKVCQFISREKILGREVD